MEIIAKTLKQQATALCRPKTSQIVSISVGRQEANSNPLSVFSRQNPATKEEAMPLIYRLAVNFPAMSNTIQVGSERINFWTVLGEQLVQLGWSKQRIEYACNQLLRNCRFKEFRVAEFLQIDRLIPVISREEFDAINNRRQPHKPIVYAHIGDKWQYVYQEDADIFGLTEYNRRYTDWEVEQMSPEERKQNGIFWI